jgi:hypothetical protein
MNDIDSKKLQELLTDYQLLQKEAGVLFSSALEHGGDPTTEDPKRLLELLRRMSVTTEGLASLYSKECSRLARQSAQQAFLLRKHQIELEKE